MSRVVSRLEGGRLLDYLVAHDELMEEKVAYFMKDTLEALQHLHTCRVAHLDLKVNTKHTSVPMLRTYAIKVTLHFSLADVFRPLKKSVKMKPRPTTPQINGN